MTTWNPNLDEVLGLEWFPTVVGNRILNGTGKSAAMKFRSTVGETIDTVLMYIDGDAVVNPNAGRWLVEVYEEGDEIPGAVSTFTARPNGVESGGADWPNAAAATSTDGNIDNSIGEDPLSTTDYVQYVGTYQDKTRLRLQFDTAAFAANKRVVGGRLVVVANREEASGQLIFSYRPSGAGNYLLGEITIDTELRTFEVPFPELNPSTSLPWTQQEILDIGDTAKDYTLVVKPVGIGKHKPARIYQMYLEIDYVAENRVAWGLLDNPDGGWITSTLDSAWTKVDDTTYVITLRRVPRWRNIGAATDVDTAVMNGGQVGWTYLEEDVIVADAVGRDVALPDPYMASYTPLLNSDGTIADMGEARTRGYTFALLEAMTYSPDGQPYVELIPTNFASDIVAEQKLTTGGANTYHRYRAIVGPRIDAVDPITLAIYTSGGVLVSGSEVDVTVDEVEQELVVFEGTDNVGNPITYYFIERDIPTPAALSAATQYHFKITGPTGETTSWDALHASTGSDGASDKGNEATFGGITDDAWSDVFSTFEEALDLIGTLNEEPDEPAGFDVNIDTQTLITDTQALTPDWLIRTLEFASATWSPTALGSDFSYYEIQRSQDGGDIWETIARITDEAVAEFRDYEGLRNVEAIYRMRVMATWFVASDWTDVAVVTPVLDGCALLFVSNEDPSINQGYVDIGGSRQWTFQSADEREAHILVGRNYQVITAPLENRGDRFEVDLAVWAGSTPEDTGRARFDQIELINQAAVSYICVLDETGRRWLADVAIGEATRTGSKIHTASATVIEVTDTPSLVDVSAGP